MSAVNPLNTAVDHNRLASKLFKRRSDDLACESDVVLAFLASFTFWDVAKLFHPKIGIRGNEFLEERKRFSHTVCVAVDASFVDWPFGTHPLFEKLDGAINRHDAVHKDTLWRCRHC